jgi:hypothetical protein
MIVDAPPVVNGSHTKKVLVSGLARAGHPTNKGSYCSGKNDVLSAGGKSDIMLLDFAFQEGPG